MPVLRDNGPYIWTTWLTKLLTGENSCEWASWFKSQYAGHSWEKIPSNFDFASWQIDHTALLNAVRQEWEAKGYTVFSEDQNSFTLRGQTATLGGKPDLIARRGQQGVIIDVKTGMALPSHSAQVMLYLYAVPRALLQYRDLHFQGQVVYGDHHVEVPASAIDDTFVSTLTGLIRRLASSDPARRVPSARECGLCDITAQDCPDRMDDESTGGTTEDF